MNEQLAGVERDLKKTKSDISTLVTKIKSFGNNPPKYMVILLNGLCNTEIFLRQMELILLQRHLLQLQGAKNACAIVAGLLFRCSEKSELQLLPLEAPHFPASDIPDNAEAAPPQPAWY